MITKITLYVGLNSKESKMQLVSNTEGLLTIENILFDFGLDATFTMCKGHYTHEDGDRIKENTVKAEMLFFDAEADAIGTTKKVVEVIKARLNQETVAVQIENVNSFLW